MNAEYSVEEVRAEAASFARVFNDRVCTMLTAYANLLERIKADEGAVPIGYTRVDCVETLKQQDFAPMIRLRQRGDYTVPLFAHPPAQAAQAFALPKSFVDRATSSDESEPQVMGAGHLVQFTTAQVDWLMTFNARLIVNGLLPEDARMWMRATDQWDFGADPVAEADSTWQDFLANPDDDGPFDPTPTAEPVAQGEAVAPNGYHYVYPNIWGTGEVIRKNDGREVDGIKPLRAIPYWYTSPAQPRAVPDRLPDVDVQDTYAGDTSALEESNWNGGWNACIDAMLAAAPSPGESNAADQQADR